MPDTFNWPDPIPSQQPPESVNHGDFIVHYAPWIARVGVLFAETLLPLSLALRLGDFGFGLFWAYIAWSHVYLQGKTGQTPLKKALGMRVCYAMKEAELGAYDLYCFPGIPRMVVRELAHCLDLICLVGLWLPLVTPKRRTVADLIARTAVIQDKRVRVFTLEEGRANRGETWWQ